MNTLSNIIPNPLNIDKTLNTNYSNSQFATSDFNGKSNTEILKNYKDNITPSKIPNGFYLGGIGEVGIIMENISYLNEIISKYGGTQISYDSKYVSSTLYNEKNISNTKYSLENTNNVWYIDNSYGKITYGPLDSPYKSIPLYKYDIKDFMIQEKEYIELESNKILALGHNAKITNASPRFDTIDFIYYCQNDFLDNLENTSAYSFFEKSKTIKYQAINSNKSSYITTVNINSTIHLNYTDNTLNSPAGVLFVKIKDTEEYYTCTILNNSYNDNHYYLYFIYNGNYYCIDSNNSQAKFKEIDINIDSAHRIQFKNLPVDLIECNSSGNNISDVYLYVQVESINESILELKNDNIIKYPIYYSNNTYSFPLLPSYKEGDYYDCEFYIFIPEFSQYNSTNNQLEKTFTIDLIFKKIKVLIQFGNGEIKEILNPYIKLNDTIIYKFKKKWTYDYKFIPNQELKIYLINSGEDENNQIIYSKKVYFNIFELKIYQNRYNSIDFRFKYNNYYPLKYPLPSKKKFIDIDYVPTDLVEDSSYDELMEINSKIYSEIDFFKDSDEEYKINFNNLVDNYSYLNHNIYHNYSEGYNISDWFTLENSYGLMISPSKENTTYTNFNFSIEDQVYENVEIYCKSFTSYDEDGILDSSNQNIEKLSGGNSRITISNKNGNKFILMSYYEMNIYGMKQLLYIPYKFDISKSYGITNKMFFMNDISLFDKYSIFEDYLYIYNSTNKSVKLYFNDESKTLCQGNRLININANSFKLYKPSRHDNYNITIKTSVINQNKLAQYKIYERYLNSPNRILNITYILSLLKTALNRTINYSTLNQAISNLTINNESQIINVPIYDYSIPLFGNIIIIK